MSTKGKGRLLLLSLGLLLASCTSNGSSVTDSKSSSGDTGSSTSVSYPMVESDDGLTDFSGVYESYKPTLDDSLNAVVDDDTVPDSAITLSDGAEIVEAGDYVLSGSYSQPIVIDVSGDDAVVHIYLDNANIATSTNAPIYSSGKKAILVITALEGTTNSLSNTASEDDIGILVNGGYLTTVSGGDGLDSNGWLEINGGVSFIQASTADDNSALDSDGGITINGGVVGAFGSLGMVETPSTNSLQDILVYGDSDGFGSGESFSVVDSAGTVCFSADIVNEYESAIVSFPEMTKGSSYQIEVDGDSVETFTVSTEPITSLGDTSRGQNGGGPGRGNGGPSGR